jgi:sugar phosphate isomerase/epimerase
VLADNDLTPVHGTVGQFGLVEPNDKHAAAIDSLKKRLELFSALGVKKVYTTTVGGQKLALDDYSKIADQLRVVGETAKAFDTMFNIEFVRASQYMWTLLTTLRVTRQRHTRMWVMFDFYHFWSGFNRLEDMDQIRPGEIQHVHFQDVPDMPRELLDNTTRLIPGDGVSPIVPMLKSWPTKVQGRCRLSCSAEIPSGDRMLAREIRQKCEAVMTRRVLSNVSASDDLSLFSRRNPA